MMQCVDQKIICKDFARREFDLAFVGAGLSTTMTLIHYLSKKLNSRHDASNSPEKIIILEKSSDFFTGVAYGQRSGHSSLIINSLADFLPSEEVDGFKDWLIENIDTVFIPFLMGGDEFSKQWHAKHYDSILNGDIGSIYIPRYVFGEYLKHRAYDVISKAEQQGGTEVSFVQAAVSDITTEGRGEKFVIEAEQEHDTQNIYCKAVVLGVGSPPVNAIDGDNNTGTNGYFGNPFDPGMGYTISKIGDRLKKQTSNNVLIVGSNASALDVIVNLTASCELRDRINSITVMSPSGVLPELYLESEESNKYKTVLLDELINKPNTTAAEILEQAKAEIALARSEGFTIAMSLGSISTTVFKIVQTLDAEQKSVFVNSVGRSIGNVQRRAGIDYFNMVEPLVACGKLDTLSGRFNSLDIKDNSYEVRYFDEQDTICELKNLQVVINCTGASTLPTQANNTFLDNLFASGLCEVNGSEIGISVNSDFQTKTKSMYVIGPLLAGNTIDGQIVWHIEHCGRISVAAEKLAGILIERKAASTEIELMEEVV